MTHKITAISFLDNGQGTFIPVSELDNVRRQVEMTRLKTAFFNALFQGAAVFRPQAETKK